MNKVKQLLVILGGLSIALWGLPQAAPAAGPPTQSMQYAGYVESSGINQASDPGQIARMAKAGGANTLRVLRKWRIGQPPTSGELQSVCNMAAAMRSEGIPNLVLDIYPDGTRYPQTQAERDQFKDVLHAYDVSLLSPVTGCAWGIKLMYQIGNEPNIPIFCPQTDEDHGTCAALYMQLLVDAYNFLQQEEKVFGTELMVIGLGLSSHHDPIGWVDEAGKYVKEHGLKGPFMDACGFNPYALPGSRNPLSGVLMRNRFVTAVTRAFGQYCPVFYTELGVETKTNPDKGYSGTTPPSIMTLTEQQQAQALLTIFGLAKTQGVIGALNFLLVDECSLNPGWQSGVYHCDGTPKDSLTNVSEGFLDLLGLSPTSM